MQIIIEDCVKVLKDSIDSGITYDYVINDLTEFPIDQYSTGLSVTLQIKI